MCRLVAAFAGVALLIQAVPPLERALAETHWDLNVDLLTAQAFLDGYNPFSREGAVRSGLSASGPAGNGHPPTTSFWFLPLARMHSRTAGAILAWLSLLLLLLQMAATMRLLRYRAPLLLAWVAFTFVIGCSYMEYHVGVGQISALIGFLYFVAWQAGRTGDDWLAGGALGVACTLKLFPGLLIVFFLLALRWRVLVAALTVYSTVAIIMTARFGISSWRGFLAQQAPIADIWMGNIQNQSIHGVVLRLFKPVCVWHGPVLLSATLISTALSLSLLAAATWVVLRRRRAVPFDLAYALFVVLSMVTSQWTWEHYAVIYVLPVLILGAHLVGRWRERKTAGTLVVMALLVTVVASWRVNVATKLGLQRAVHQGKAEEHLMLHLYDLLNWGPGVVLLGLLYAVALWQGRELLTPNMSRPRRDP